MTFPPASNPLLTQVIRAYLYQEYADDDDLQAFWKAYNDLAQQYVDWFSTIGLPIYTGLSGDLLTWVARGLYGARRPSSISDDLFQRVLTWNFYKGDGTVFSVQNLRRRIIRFLLGTNGVTWNVDQTYVWTIFITSISHPPPFPATDQTPVINITLTHGGGPNPVTLASCQLFQQALNLNMLNFPPMFKMAVTF